VRGGWGQSHNTIATPLAGSDSFNSTRWMISSSLSGRWTDGQLSFAPTASFSYFKDKSDSFTDYLGTTIPSVSTVLGQLKLSPELSYSFETDSGLLIKPSLTPELIWNFANTGVGGLGNLDAADAGTKGVRGRVKAGVNIKTRSGMSIGLSASYDGIGSKSYSSISALATIHVPLN
jgi:outer membrane autotransporter protein